MRQQRHAPTEQPYLYELLVCLVHLVENAGSVFHKVSDCIHVVEGHKEDVLGSGAKEHLVLESHGHQVIELWRRTHKQDLTGSIHKLK